MFGRTRGLSRKPKPKGKLFDGPRGNEPNSVNVRNEPAMNRIPHPARGGALSPNEPNKQFGSLTSCDSCLSLNLLNSRIISWSAT